MKILSHTLIILGILAFFGGLIVTIFDQDKDYGREQVPCYDRFAHYIQGEVCFKEKESPVAQKALLCIPVSALLFIGGILNEVFPIRMEI